MTHGFRKSHHVSDDRRVRAARSVSAKRIKSYPIEEWLTEDDSVIWDTTKAEGFPDISRAYFIQDLHRVAREATERARQAGEPTGWRAATTTRGHDEDGISFWFYRAPFEECPAPRVQRSRTAAGQLAHFPEQTVQTVQALGGPSLIDPQRVAAWQAQATALLWCHDPNGVYQAHQVGGVQTCPYCAGRTPRTVTTPTPPASWSPGQPIPEDIA